MPLNSNRTAAGQQQLHDRAQQNVLRHPPSPPTPTTLTVTTNKPPLLSMPTHWRHQTITLDGSPTTVIWVEEEGGMRDRGMGGGGGGDPGRIVPERGMDQSQSGNLDKDGDIQERRERLWRERQRLPRTEEEEEVEEEERKEPARMAASRRGRRGGTGPPSPASSWRRWSGCSRRPTTLMYMHASNLRCAAISPKLGCR